MDLGNLISILGMEMGRRMVRAIHVDDDSVEDGQPRHGAIVDDRPAAADGRRYVTL
jgi:hypothetical protein